MANIPNIRNVGSILFDMFGMNVPIKLRTWAGCKMLLNTTDKPYSRVLREFEKLVAGTNLIGYNIIVGSLCLTQS